MTTPNGQRNPVETPRTKVVQLFATLTGGGASTSLVNSDAAVNGGGEIVSATWTTTGTYSVVFAKKWPQVLCLPDFSFLDATASNVSGMNGICTAFSATAGTATFVFAVNTTPTDLLTSTTVTVNWAVRAVSKN